MQTEVIRTREALATLCTFKRLFTCVSSVVTCKLIWATECPIAFFPWALKWLFSRVDSLVSLEMGTLGVHLVALRIVTSEEALCLACRFCEQFSRRRRLHWTAVKEKRDGKIMLDDQRWACRNTITTDELVDDWTTWSIWQARHTHTYTHHDLTTRSVNRPGLPYKACTMHKSLILAVSSCTHPVSLSWWKAPLG